MEEDTELSQEELAQLLPPGHFIVQVQCPLCHTAASDQGDVLVTSETLEGDYLPNGDGRTYRQRGGHTHLGRLSTLRLKTCEVKEKEKEKKDVSRATSTTRADQ